jgi:hypothetical protein
MFKVVTHAHHQESEDSLQYRSGQLEGKSRLAAYGDSQQSAAVVIRLKVELIGRNSNLGHLCKKWADLRERINASSPRPPLLYQERSKIRSKRFLTDQDVADIQGRYEGGETTQQIGVSYGVSKTRVARTLREQGVPLRRQGLTNEQASEAADLYAGKSLACLAARYAVSPMTVSRALRRQGIQLRSRPGW